MGRRNSVEPIRSAVSPDASVPPHHRATRAAGYLRRSTDRQEQSIPDQQRAVEAFAAEQGLRLLRCYIDDAISGTSTVGRRAFQQMIEDAKSPSCDFGVVIVYDVKRFGRIDNDEAGYYRHVLRQAGVEVLYASEGFTRDGTDDLLRPVKQWQARQESKNLGKVTIRGVLSRTEAKGAQARPAAGGWAERHPSATASRNRARAASTSSPSATHPMAPSSCSTPRTEPCSAPSAARRWTPSRLNPC